jgi:hypothetical protein
MELAIEFVKILAPAAIVLYAMYLTVRSFLNKEREEKLIQIKAANTDVVAPIRLQAYERLVLLLERISPNNLISRLNTAKMSAVEFQHLLLREIREEFNHNLSQQVYTSDEAWNLVKNAKEEVVALVNRCAQEMGEDATSVDLSKKIFNTLLESDTDITSTALVYLKDEIRTTF